ncbi:MAG: hypothetical protein EPN21_10045 [Methylococcaceae bacterium]|nr:MAG: hypothetical protein EPN21_10045 [Methylococcaceae bacterium]
MDTHHEKLSQLSLLMDDALAAVDARRLLADMAHDPALATSWRHYHWMRQSLRGEPALSADVDFADRIHRQLASEPVSLHSHRNRRREWLKPAGGLALAATLAAMAVLGVREYGVAQLPYDQAGWHASSGITADVQQAGYGLLSPEKLQEYLVMHNEGVYLAGAGDLLPQARVVSFVHP